MSLAYIRHHYSVPAYNNGRVKFSPAEYCSYYGKIVGSDGARLKVEFADPMGIRRVHPTWRIKYITPEKAPK